MPTTNSTTHNMHRTHVTNVTGDTAEDLDFLESALDEDALSVDEAVELIS